VQTFKKIILMLMILVIVLAAGMFYAPGFLAYSTNYAKADAVVLFLGPDFSARQRHAMDLIRNGMANCLIIPAYNRTFFMEQGKLKNLAGKRDKNNISGKVASDALPYYEDTHLELIAAKKTMKKYGKKTAIFVSSPYHMRRIQIMVGKEFDPDAQYFFSPTPYEPAPLSAWDLKTPDWKKIWREYVKILWFKIYSLWTS